MSWKNILSCALQSLI